MSYCMNIGIAQTRLWSQMIVIRVDFRRVSDQNKHHPQMQQHLQTGQEDKMVFPNILDI